MTPFGDLIAAGLPPGEMRGNEGWETGK